MFLSPYPSEPQRTLAEWQSIRRPPCESPGRKPPKIFGGFGIPCIVGLRTMRNRERLVESRSPFRPRCISKKENGCLSNEPSIGSFTPEIKREMQWLLLVLCLWQRLPLAGEGPLSPSLLLSLLMEKSPMRGLGSTENSIL